jgi:hypothetical protein
MRPIARWRHMMSSVVVVEPRTGTDGDSGVGTYGSPLTYRAHLSRKVRLVRNAAGEEVNSGQAVYLDASVAVQPTDRVTLSTGDVGSTGSHQLQPAIIAVERRFDGDGPHHVVVYLE